MKTGISEQIKSCRLCSKSRIESILNLGAQPPANSLREDKKESLDLIPLVLCRCEDCGTVQLTETVAPDYLFNHYVWVTGTSKGAQQYSQVFCDRLISRSQKKLLSVIEIASNDGTFLKPFKERGHKVLGVDPAKNIAARAIAEGIPTVADFFGLKIAEKIKSEQGQADIVFARNVIPHVANAKDVVAGLAHLLQDQGIGVIEFHRADIILKELHYDSIYHEHLFYHSLHSIQLLLEGFGLKLFDITESPISGGSWVVYFSKTNRPPTPQFLQALEEESFLGIQHSAPWKKFSEQCEKHKRSLLSLVEQFTKQGKRLIGYGASARSSTLLNYCGINYRHLGMIADQNSFKQGRYTPGTDILISSPKEAFDTHPDAVLLLAWNFKDEILNKIQSDYQWHGDVIIPLPGEPSVIKI